MGKKAFPPMATRAGLCYFAAYPALRTQPTKIGQLSNLEIIQPTDVLKMNWVYNVSGVKARVGPSSVQMRGGFTSNKLKSAAVTENLGCEKTGCDKARQME